jgi:hypothetical protein
VCEGGLFFVRARFEAGRGERVVCAHASSAALSPALLARFAALGGGGERGGSSSAVLAVVERDGACSFFELAPLPAAPPPLPACYPLP